MKKITLFFILATLFVFVCFRVISDSKKMVMNVLQPDLLQIDLNNNRVIDDNETVCVAGLEAFTSNLLLSQELLANKYNIKLEDAIKLGFITDNYVESLLQNQMVKLKFTKKHTPYCRYAEIFYNGENYAQKLADVGLGIYNSRKSQKFYQNLERAQKLKLSILNHRSNKYHNLSCEYGLLSHDAVVIYTKDLPKNSKPCKFCHLSFPQRESAKSKISNIPPPPMEVTSGNIKFFLTDITVKLKPDKKCDNNVCKSILNEINQAQHSLDIAVYGWGSAPVIEKAIKNAVNRGVKLRLVFDTSDRKEDYYPNTQNLVDLAEISSSDKSVKSAHTNYLMHNKFIIIDNKTVLTGSMNYSSTGLSGFNANNLLIIKSDDIARLYTEEFEQMLSGKFHNDKAISLQNRTFDYGTNKVSIFFSPKDRVISNQLITLVNSSKKYVYVPSFLVTHEELTNALIRARKRGVIVKLILDATNANSKRSAIKKLRNSGISVKVENYAGKMHSKSIIIDDKYVVTGSMNFSNSGEMKNDENILIIDDPKFAIFYRNFFDYLWKKIPEKYSKQNVRSEGRNSIGSCSDGIDNNFDGKIDSEDEGCKFSAKR